VGLPDDPEQRAVLIDQHFGNRLHRGEPDPGPFGLGLYSPLAMAIVRARICSCGMTPMKMVFIDVLP
jgi:hypothetical protein